LKRYKIGAIGIAVIIRAGGQNRPKNIGSFEIFYNGMGLSTFEMDWLDNFPANDSIFSPESHHLK